MDQAEFLEAVFGAGTEIIIERWEKGKKRREVYIVGEGGPIEGEDVFFLLPSDGRFIFSNTDAREPRLSPTIRIETSPGRFTCCWLLSESIGETQRVEIAGYVDPWSPPYGPEDGVRVPGTVSTRRAKVHAATIVEYAPERTYGLASVYGLGPPDQTVLPIDPHWHEGREWTEEELKDALANLPKDLRKTWTSKESKPMGLMGDLIRGGVEVATAIRLVVAAPGYNRSLNYGKRLEFARSYLIARAKQTIGSLEGEITKLRGNKRDKRKTFQVRASVSSRIITDFTQKTTILHAREGTLWAVDKSTGRAMEVSRGSSPISHFINRRYGINPTDGDHNHVIEDLRTLADGYPPIADTTAISYYQREHNQMLICFGGKEIAVVSDHDMQYQENGTGNVIFRNVLGASPIDTRLLHVGRALDQKPGAWWDAILPPSHLGNLVKGDPAAVSALLHVWTIFSLFRNSIPSRPILALLGPAGSGKTTFSKLIYLLMYGEGVKLFTVSSIEKWDTVTSNYPITMFDNVDHPTPWWLPPKLAISISPTDSPKRALFTNNDVYVQRCDSIVGLSSHDPSFLKDDIIDRMLLIQFRRIADAERLEETPMLAGVLRNREYLLAGLIADVIRTLAQEETVARGSIIRMVDFASMGRRIAKAIGKEDEFVSAISDLAVHQKAKTLEEDAVLVIALDELKVDSNRSTEWLTAGEIWQELLLTAEDGGDTIKRVYKGPQLFKRKLEAIYTHLNEALGLDRRDDAARGWTTYRLVDPDRPDPSRRNGKAHKAESNPFADLGINL